MTITELVETDHRAAHYARRLLEARNNLFDARPYAFSESDDFCAVEENQATNAVYYLAEKMRADREAVLTAVDDLWNGTRDLTETIDWLRRLS